MTTPAVESLAAALERHYGELRAFLTRKLGCPSLAADVMQDVWLRVSAQREGPAVQNLRAYLYRVAGNLATDRLRHEQMRERHTPGGELPEDVACAQPLPDEVLESEQEYAILQRAVAELPDKCREVFLLYRGQNLSMKDIAARLDISDRTVEKHIAKAMLQCRQRLREAGRHV